MVPVIELVCLDGGLAMATIIAQTQKMSGFFGRIAQRLYNARLANAEREVNHHRSFLGTPKGW
jgi:hypothetical protein